MIEHIFSNSFREALKSKKISDIINIDPDLRELIVAAIGNLLDEHLIWLVGENENFIEKEKKLQSWLKLLGKDDVSICYFKLPFEDPYVNNHFDLSALSNKIKLVLELLRQKRLIVISTMAALSIKIEKRSLLKNFSFSLRVGDRIDRNQFLSRLMDMGYQSRDFVDQKGDLSWRGSIVDVFLVSEENPVRIEFWGGEAKSIRFFDFQTQKSIRNINEVLISGASYFLGHCTLEAYFSGNQENMAYITDLLKNVRIISSDFKKISHEYITLLNNFSRIRSLSRERKKPAKKVSEIFNFQLDRNKVMSISDVFDELKSKAEIAKIKKSILEFNQGDIKNIERKIKKEGYHCFVGSENEKIIENLKIFWGDFQTFHFNFPFSFQNKKNRTLFLTFKNFDSQVREYKFENETIETDHLLNRIKSNDFVVHKQHGIGKFLGIQKLEFDRIVSEFLQIEYQHKEFLYVPVYELDVLSKYVAFEGYYPRIDKLGGKTWQTKQSRAKKSMVVFARDLLELYALRRSIKGYVYPGDYDMESKLQQGFRYVETKDQKGALRDVMRDLESETPMDRLVCGDVSFGKTEVAIRAAFRVILDGGQVVILCPTTILAWQHHETFKKRFSDFPVRVGLLSRMVPMNKKRSIYQDLENGKIDVVIGTHSLISGEIKFKNLGLVIIDEEQRFGVFQKEKLKKNREDIDVLSLSATPIPRTLSLALSGLQDLSIIQSPPIGRLAVKNYVGYFSKEIVLSAILNEMERDGLVFIVYNNIDKIYSFKERLQTWLPEVKMTLIHAKMRSKRIEENLMGFIQKKYRILVSTTIIENGIDIPDVNTLIVVNAERFGLTQLYQLRGRIGRGNRQAYAFFLVQSPRIGDKAKSRLDAIREFADLGSGYKLAEFDLKLRGMGSLLGNKQHGHIEALGFDYYLELLNQMIKELKGEDEEQWESKMKIHFPYSIDSNYISDASERIRYYKKILEARRVGEIFELKEELADRFGPFDENVENIFLVGLMRIMAHRYHFKEVEVFEDKIQVLQSDQDVEKILMFQDFLKKIRYEKIDHNKYILFIYNFERLCQEIKGDSRLGK